MPPIFAGWFDPERANAFFMYLLSIIGGGVAGFFAAMGIGKLTDRFLLGKGKKSPATLHKFFRWFTGLAVAILVAIFFFPGGGGGRGTGEGKEDGPNKTGAPSDGTGGPDPKTVAQPPTPLPKGTVIEPDEKARSVIHLEILGGSDLKAGTDFYREVGKEKQLKLEGEKDSVEKLVADRKATLKPGVGVSIEYRLTRYSMGDLNFQGLSTLKTWGDKNNVIVSEADK